MGTQAARHRGQRSVVYGLGFMAVLSAVLLLSAGRAHAAGTQIVDQSQRATNRGTANANSGGNRAVGNNSVNTAAGNQRSLAGGGGGGQSVANNSGASRNTSDGSASINTGDAGATGTSAHTTAAQTANTGGGTRAVDIVDQTSRVDNAGAALARTGNNAAIGNNSDNLARTTQLAVAGRGNGRSVANNSAATSNDSDGRANISTGDADATGVDATTNVDQSAHGRGDGRGGVSIVDQTSSVDNRGAAAALTGDNRAIGNNSLNTATENGAAFAGRAGRFGRSVANNSGGASNRSDGTATITSGDADATGVDAHTTTTQSAFGGGGNQNGVAIVDENAPVTNRGSALARSGGNGGVGNNTDNLSRRFLRAFTGRAGFFRGRAVANNSGAASNHSDGTTRIVTGDASAVGTLVRTVIRQLRG